MTRMLTSHGGSILSAQTTNQVNKQNLTEKSILFLKRNFRIFKTEKSVQVFVFSHRETGNNILKLLLLLLVYGTNKCNIFHQSVSDALSHNKTALLDYLGWGNS